MRRKHYVGIVDFTEGEDNEYECINCPMCEKLEIYPIPKLGPKLLLNGAKPQPDHENWLQCPSCAWLCPIYEAMGESNIKDTTETIDNPFEHGKFVSASIPNRTSVAGKKASDKARREKNRMHHKDKEIDSLLRIYGEDNVRIIEDTDP